MRVSPLAHVRDAGALLGRAGFALPAVDTDTLTVRYPSPVEVVAHLREMGEANAAVDRRKGLPRDTALATAAAYAALFAADDGTVPATWQVIYMAGVQRAWARLAVPPGETMYAPPQPDP